VVLIATVPSGADSIPAVDAFAARGIRSLDLDTGPAGIPDLVARPQEALR
jgi:hypothetical protein